MDILRTLDSWDYLMVILFIGSAWLLLGGIGVLKKSAPEVVDADRLRNRAFGAVVASLVYLGVKLFCL